MAVFTRFLVSSAFLFAVVAAQLQLAASDLCFVSRTNDQI